MSARASARLLRFARMELRHGLRWKATLDAWRRASGRRISGCWVAAFVVVAVLWATVSFGIARGALVEWADPPIAPVTVLAWLLWSLGGLYAAAAAFVTGWATWDDPYAMASNTSRPSATWALPLSWHQVVAAKALGRTAAFCVHLLIAVAILAVARLLMTAAHLVSVPPSLADPWFYDAFLAFPGFFIASVRITSAARRDHAVLAGLRFGAFIMAAGSGFLAAAKLFPTDQFLNWWSVAGFALALAGVIGLALLQALPPVRRLEQICTGRSLGRMKPTAGSGEHAWRHIGFLVGYMSIATRGLGGMRGRTGAWLVAMARYIGGISLVLTLASAVLQGGAFAYGSIAGMVTAGRPALPDPYFIDFLVGLPALGVFGLAITGAGMTMWPEAMPGGIAALMRQQLSPEAGRHLGDTLPAEPSRVWTQRLMTLPVVWVMLALGGVATLALSQGARVLLDPRVTPGAAEFIVPTLVPTIGALAVVVSLSLFLVMPMVHRARKLIPVAPQSLGCLSWAAVFGGMAVPLIVMFSLGMRRYMHMRLAISEGFVVALLAWLLLSLIVSRALWRPGAWSSDDEGRPTAGAFVQAVGVYAWTVLGAFLTGTMFQTLATMIPD